MIYLISGVSLLFLVIAFSVTRNNARYFLSGYNTMSDENRKKVDLPGYIIFFRKFHLFLGLSFFIVGMILYYLAGVKAAGIFIGIYPLLAYIYFIPVSTRFFRGLTTRWHRAVVIILSVTLVSIITLFWYSFSDNDLIVHSQGLELKGMYGESLEESEIDRVELIYELPGIALRTNGFALGSSRKGYFKTESGEIIKFILNTDASPFILITTGTGQKIYFSSANRSSQSLFEEIRKVKPGIVP